MTQTSARRTTSPRTRRVIRYCVGLSAAAALAIPAWSTWYDLTTPQDGAPSTIGELSTDYLSRVVSSGRHDPTPPLAVVAAQPEEPITRNLFQRASGAAALQQAIFAAAAELESMKAAQEAARTWHVPVAVYYISSEFGEMRDTGPHAGVDFAGVEGKPVVAAKHGVVTESGWHGGYGYRVTIDHGEGLTTRYGHLAAPPEVAVGQAVVGGEVVGELGNTGDSTGPHLHFELMRDDQYVDPAEFIRFPANRGLASLG